MTAADHQDADPASAREAGTGTERTSRDPAAAAPGKGPARPLVRKIGELISGNLLNAILNAGLGIYVARLIGPNDKGILAIVTGTILLMTMAFGLGTQFSASYFIRRRPAASKSILGHLNFTQGFCILMSAALILAGRDAFSRLFLDGREADAVLIGLVLAAIVGGNANVIFGSCIIARGDSRAFAGISLAGTAVSAAMILGFLGRMDWKLHLVIGAGAAGALVSAVLSRRAYAAYVPADGHDVVSRREFFGFGLKAQIGQLSGLFFKRADLFIIGYYLDATAVGYYSIGLSLRDLAIIIPRSIAGIVSGELSDPELPAGRKVRMLGKALLGTAAFSTLLAAGCSFAFPYVIPLFYTEAFEPAVQPAVLIMWSFVPLALSVVVANALNAEGKPLALSLSNIAAAVISGLLLWLLAWKMGLYGAGLAAIGGAMAQLALNGAVFLYKTSLVNRKRAAR